MAQQIDPSQHGTDPLAPDVLAIGGGTAAAALSAGGGDVFDARDVLSRLRPFRILYAMNAIAVAPGAPRRGIDRRRRAASGCSGAFLRGSNP